MERQTDSPPDRRLRTTMLYLARLLAGATQHELARAAGIKVQTLSGYERGLRTPRLPTATRLALELHVPLGLIGQDVELVALDLPGHTPAAPGQVVAEVRIASTAPASMLALESKEEAASLVVNAASDSYARHDPARNRNARVPVR
jgi:transcriptional regulator with XRE-family HTH domain